MDSTYDALHRTTSVTYTGPYTYPTTPNKYFVYDSATVNGNQVANVFFFGTGM